MKLSGLAVDEQDPEVREIYREVVRARIDRAPDEPGFHLFSLDVREAAYVRFGHDPVVWRWDDRDGFRELRHPDA